jgi:pilus assembly protein CpaE
MAPKVPSISDQSILIVTDDERFRQSSVDVLSVVSGYRVSAYPTADLLGGRVPVQAADVVVLDVGHGEPLSEPRLFEARRQIDPNAHLIVVSENIEATHLRQVVRLSALDWLKKPLARGELLDAVARSLSTRENHSARVTAFVSAVGGSGASMLAMNAAYLAVESKGKRLGPHDCVLFELDFSAGSCGNFLDIGNDYDFTDVLEHPSRIDTEFIDIIRKQHSSGFSLLSFKSPIVQLHSGGSEIVLRILDVLTFQFNFVIVDVPYYETRWRNTVLEGASDVVIVTNPTIPALRQAQHFDRNLSRLRDAQTVRLVANRYRRTLFSRGLAKKDIMRIFEHRPIEFLPEADELFVEAANRGLVPVELEPRGGYSKQIRKFVKDYIT